MIIWQLYSRNHFKAGWGLRNHDCVLCLMMSFNLCLMFVCLMHFQFLSCIWWMFLLFFFFVQAHWACRMGSEHRLWCEYFGHCIFVFNAKHSKPWCSVLHACHLEMQLFTRFHHGSEVMEGYDSQMQVISYTMWLEGVYPHNPKQSFSQISRIIFHSLSCESVLDLRGFSF